MKPLDHFCDLARHGQSPGASSGELRARRIALALVDNLPGLDEMAIAGLIHFVARVEESPDVARASVDGWTE